MLWHDIKELIGALGLSEDALHVYVGVLIFVVAVKLTRRPLFDPLPLAIVAFAALLNEGQDIKNWIEWGEGLQLLNSVGDIVNTVLLPAAATLWARWSRSAASQSAQEREQPQTETGTGA